MFLDFKTSYVVYYLQLIRSFLCVILDYKIEKEKRIPIKLLRFLFITSSAYITNQMYFCSPKNILQLSNFNMYFQLHELHVHIFTCYDSIQFFSGLVLMLLMININNILNMLYGYINCFILTRRYIECTEMRQSMALFTKNFIYYITCIGACVESPAVVTCPQTSEGVSTYPMVK